ncbi:MAG: tetratricopeptide repeat protein [Haliscomenobacter sp.]|nr:tetratricopeptide repeat protein [Haliscomenobacter sp.]MBK9488649.1 tetratricopeptide repeat protein [Haliscomenobacter sp.]
MAKGRQVRKVASPKAATRPEDEVLVDIVEVRDRAQDTLNRFRKPLMIAGGAVLALIIGVIAWKLYVNSQQKDAVEQMRQAERLFERDSFAVAMLTTLPGGFKGFPKIIEDFPGTPAANLANYYSGVCLLNLGKYEAAISYLKDFSAKGAIMPIMKNGALGDAYSELKDFAQAKSYYKKAVSGVKNDLLTPFYLKRLAMLAEMEKDYATAREHYQTLKDEYPSAPEGEDAEKYLIYFEGK